MILWYFDIDELPDPDTEILINKLPEEIRSYISKFQLPKDRKHRLIARLLIQKFVFETENHWSWDEFGKDKNGRPFLLNGPHFSIAHSGNLVTVVFDKVNEIGIDVELMNPIDFSLVSNNFHPEEIIYLQEYNFETNHFYKIWTRKEALLKALGIGMMEGLDKISVLDESIFYQKQWQFRNIDLDPKYKCSVCYSSDSPSIQIQQINLASFYV